MSFAGGLLLFNRRLLLMIGVRLCVNFVPAYRDVADKLGDAQIGLQNGARDEEHNGGVLGEPEKSGTEYRESGNEEVREAGKQ